MCFQTKTKRGSESSRLVVFARCARVTSRYTRCATKAAANKKQKKGKQKEEEAQDIDMKQTSQQTFLCVSEGFEVWPRGARPSHNIEKGKAPEEKSAEPQCLFVCLLLICVFQTTTGAVHGAVASSFLCVLRRQQPLPRSPALGGPQRPSQSKAHTKTPLLLPVHNHHTACRETK